MKHIYQIDKFESSEDGAYLLTAIEEMMVTIV